MRYEIVKEHREKLENKILEEILAFPLEVRIFPEETDVKELFIAMIQSAYEMDGTPGLGGLATLNEPDFIDKKEASKFILYNSKRSLKDKILRKPDTRIPIEIRADCIRGRAIKLKIHKSEEESKAYDMDAYAFKQAVGSVYKLFELTEEKLS